MNVAYSCLLGSLCLVPAAHSQALDQSRPMQIVVAFSPGAKADTAAREIGARLAGKVTIVVDNKPGAAGHIGWSTVAAAPPDGRTALLDYRFNDTKSMRTAVYLGDVPLVLVSSSNSRLASLRDVVSEAKASPGRINFASPGNRTQEFAAFQKLQQMTGFKATPVHYQGHGQALQDLKGSQVELAFVQLDDAVEIEKSGKGRLLGVSSDKRLPDLPHVPTLAEAGSPGYQYQMRYRLMVPAATPREVDQQWQRLVADALKDQDARERLRKRGLVLRPDGSGTPGNEPCATDQKECPNGACVPKDDTCPGR